MFSIIVSTVHDASALRPVFLTSCKYAELIIIDPKYNEQTGNELREMEHSYKRVIYAPPKQSSERKEYEFLSSHNTGLAYAEGPWCLAMGDNVELKPDFFYRLLETINLYTPLYNNRFVVRPVDLEQNSNDARWVSYISFKQRYFFLPCAPLGMNGMRQFVPIVTCGAVVAHLETWFLLNGFDERYDRGMSWYDNDLFDRLVIMRYHVILDQMLMTYRLPNKPISTVFRDECRKIYNETVMERNTSIRSPNPFDLQEMHTAMMNEKKRYVL